MNYSATGRGYVPAIAHCSCGEDKQCDAHRRLARAEQLRSHWWTFALRAARRFHAATTTHERTLAWRELRRVPEETGRRALYAEARP